MPGVMTDAMAAGGGKAKRTFTAMMGRDKINIAKLDTDRRGCWRRRHCDNLLSHMQQKVVLHSPCHFSTVLPCNPKPRNS
jgi:hypothetical protein